jgi:hypothetical protein
MHERSTPDRGGARPWQIAALATLLVAAFGLRLVGIAEPSVEQRETQSAILARAWYLGEGSSLSPETRVVLAAVREQVEPLEPPLLDALATVSFHVTGGPNFWFPRLISVLLWVAAGLAVFRIARRLTSVEGSLVAVALYLFWPYAVWHSRKFMPDAAMVSALLVAVLATIRYAERPGRGRLAAAGLLASVATAIKPGVAFLVLLGVFVALAIEARWPAGRLAGRVAGFAALAVAPTLAYLLVGQVLTGFVSDDAATRRVTPDLLTSSGFWSGWWEMVSFLLRFPQPQHALAVAALVLGVVGVSLAGPGRPRAILVGLTGGYVAFALAFANYTSTHPYYSLVLIPILALAIGVVADRALAVAGRGRWRSTWLVAAGLLLIVVGAGTKGRAVLSDTDNDVAIADYRRIGELTRHTTRAIAVDERLGTPLMYWGWVVAQNWELDYNDSLPSWVDPRSAEYLVVIGNENLESHRGLAAFARGRPVVGRTERYTVFDLRPAA